MWVTFLVTYLVYISSVSYKKETSSYVQVQNLYIYYIVSFLPFFIMWSVPLKTKSQIFSSLSFMQDTLLPLEHTAQTDLVKASWFYEWISCFHSSSYSFLSPPSLWFSISPVACFCSHLFFRFCQRPQWSRNFPPDFIPTLHAKYCCHGPQVINQGLTSFWTKLLVFLFKEFSKRWIC